jgi:hypothetical protein
MLGIKRGNKGSLAIFIMRSFTIYDFYCVFLE